MRCFAWSLAVACLLVVAGCGKTVGDTCANNTACGAGLICDLSVPEGYCTRSPCRKGECPAESVCVDFGAEASWCMRRCDQGQGCRAGISCLDSSSEDVSATCLDDVGTCAFCGVAP